MRVGVENQWRLNGVQIRSMRARTKMLMSFESHRFNLVLQLLFSPLDPSLPKNKVKYSTRKSRHISAVLVYFAKIFREISVEKYKEFKEVNFVR